MRSLNGQPWSRRCTSRLVSKRGAELERSHKRVRQAVGLRVRELAVAPQFPPDLLGVLILQPVV